MKETSRIVSRLLGEADETASVDVPVPGEGKVTSPSVDALVASWQAGDKHAVALRVLDALDSYEDFVGLLFVIGEADAQELGRIMDELTSDESSPHKYDTMSDEMALKSTNRPPADSPGAMGSTESLNPTQVWLKRLRSQV